MRWIVLAVGLLVQSQPQPAATSPDTIMRVVAISGRCVATAPMPMARLRSSDPMPAAELDVSRSARTPVALLRPCYWVDSGQAVLRP